MESGVLLIDRCLLEFVSRHVMLVAVAVIDHRQHQRTIGLPLTVNLTDSDVVALTPIGVEQNVGVHMDDLADVVERRSHAQSLVVGRSSRDSDTRSRWEGLTGRFITMASRCCSRCYWRQRWERAWPHARWQSELSPVAYSDFCPLGSSRRV